MRDRPDALAAAFRQYRPLVVRVLARVCAGWAEAEELAQEVFITLGEKPLDPHHDDIRAWLLRTAIRRGLNANRGRQRRRSREAAVGPSLAGSPAASAEYLAQRSRAKRIN
ncbi:MAG: RNA polymerase sigma factor [Nannocystales bacterium]